MLVGRFDLKGILLVSRALLRLSCRRRAVTYVGTFLCASSAKTQNRPAIPSKIILALGGERRERAFLFAGGTLG